jgi:hypothetical protein
LKHVRFFAMLVFCCLSIVAYTGRAFAGSTGGLSGVLTDTTTGAPLPGAKVTVASPSQVATLVTDAAGSFSFLSLAPDTYTVSAELAGYDQISTSGVTVQADQIQRLTLRASKVLRTIGSVRTRSSEELVRPGTVTDTYSINAATQARITGLTGGGSLNQGYSALAVTPGVFVPSGQSGWSQTAGVTVRGGTHSQIGYEYDGVPVNVGVNGFSGTNLSTLGQQEIQVYSGSAPLNSEAQGLSGYVNQVVKTGTYPGFEIGELGIGGPFYHKASFEIGGATKDRNFTYYLGTLGANQAFNVADNYNGASDTPTYGLAYNVLPCPGGPTSLDYSACYPAHTSGGLGVGPGGFVKAPIGFLSSAYQQDRESVVNLHFGIPHKNGTKDDVQLLYQTGGITSQPYSSADDLGVAPYDYPSGYIYTGALATLLPANYKANVTPYAFPQSTVGEQIPANLRDTQQNNQSIFKAQYQHNMGNAYVRVYGYSLYSTFQYDAPNGGSSPASNSFGDPPDYKLWTHTSGYSGEFADQLSSKDLVLAQASYTHAPSVRDNNTAWTTGPNAAFAVAVDSTNPNSGLCYGVAGGVATPASCQTGDGQASFVTYGSALGLAGSTAPASLAGAKCGAGPCSYYVVDNGNSGADNTVVANNVAAALSDQWKPTRQLTIDAGIRFHDYGVQGADTGGGARDFWFNAYNQDYCVNANPGSTPVSKASLKIAVTAACGAANGGGNTYVATQVSNGPADYNFIEYEPRVGVTYAAGQNDVFRASYGKYSEPAPTAYQQYDTHQQNLAAYLATRFYKYGYTGSGHDIPPQESFNLDGSWEHGFKGTDVSFKATPYYRTTRNELTEFFIDPVNQLTSGLAVGSLKASGVEFQLRKGSFERNGFAALLNYTYTNASIKYYTLPGGGSILSPINNDIKTYNAYTSFCAAHATDARCGSTTANGKAAACYTAGGVPDAGCAAGDIANPYWNAPVQSTLDPNGSYVPTDPVVATTGLGVNSYTVPHVASFVLNYRHNAFAITPSVQFQAGQRYGLPEANAGIDPAAGCSPLAGATTANDPRYTYGAAGGAPYDALTCKSALTAIPDVFTNKFDAIGAFTSPSQLLGSFTASYDVTKNLTISLTGANVFNQCFGGTKAEWTGIGSPHVCSYESGEISRGTVPTGNAYNPGAKFDPFGQNPYYAYLGPYTMGVVNPSAPLEFFLNARLKL